MDKEIRWGSSAFKFPFVAALFQNREEFGIDDPVAEVGISSA